MPGEHETYAGGAPNGRGGGAEDVTGATDVNRARKDLNYKRGLLRSIEGVMQKSKDNKSR